MISREFIERLFPPFIWGHYGGLVLAHERGKEKAAHASKAMCDQNHNQIGV